MITTIALGITTLLFAVAAYILYNNLSAERRRCVEKQTESALYSDKLREMSRRTEQAEKDGASLRNKLSECQLENARLTERIKNIEENEIKKAREIEQEKDRINRESEARFNMLATKILDDHSKKFKEQNETRLSEILDPLKNDIEQFKKTVSDTYSTEARERFALQEKIKELVELNRSIGREAKDLTDALKGNSKIQGDWGEMILETILEKSGLKKGYHFQIQQTTDESGNVLKDHTGKMLRPDVIINYPDRRCVVIDSKVSLTAYVNMMNAEKDQDREHFGQQHLLSVKSHIKELSTKNYQDFIGEKKTDFVMMFIPNESAYMVAMNLDPNLWQEAYDRRVLIISPTHLISALRLVEQLWRQDDMKRNVLEIATESGRMYDKFVGFLDDMVKIEKGLDLTRTSFDNAMKKLKTGPGNLIRKAENLRLMGAKTTKRMNSNMIPDQETDEDLPQTAR